MTTRVDHEEWLQLEASQPQVNKYGRWIKEQDVGVKAPYKPHPQSYRPDLPLRGLGLNGTRPTRTRKWTLTAADRKVETPAIYVAEPIIIKKNAPHPDSHGAHLPLRGELRGYQTKKWTLTVAEKKMLAGRPMKFVRAA